MPDRPSRRAARAADPAAVGVTPLAIAYRFAVAYRGRVAGFLATHLGGPHGPVEAGAGAAAMAVARPRDREGPAALRAAGP